MNASHDEPLASLTLDLADERAWLAGKRIPLTPKAFETLRYLVAHRGRLVTKDELLRSVWRGAAVGDSVLTTTIHEIRRALGERSRGATFIQTVHRRGYRFVGPLAPAESGASEGRGDRAASALFGRADELARCADWLRRAAAGRRQVAFVSGDAGIGKTAVVDAFLERAAAMPGVRVARGQCIELYGVSEAYRPWLDALAQLCRDSESGSTVVDVLRRFAPMALAQLPAFVGVEERRALLDEMATAAPERMARELAEALDRLSSDRPLVVALEDVHWADRPSLELISLVAQRREPARLLLIATLRPLEMSLVAGALQQIKEHLEVRGLCEEASLEALSRDAVVDYVNTQLPGLPEDFGELVHRRTDGHALFMVNLLDYLVRSGLVMAEAGQWDLRGDLRAIETTVPESLRLMIERQFGRLDAEDRRLLETAAVVGVDFADATIASALGIGIEEASARCRALSLRGAFLRPGPEESWPDGTAARRYAFRHALYPEILYSALPPSGRIRLHRTIGERLEAGFGEQSIELAAGLASHFERGREIKRAVFHLGRAARNAGQRLAYLEMIRVLYRALELLEELPEDPDRKRQELALLMALAPALVMTAGYAAPKAESTYARAEALCREVGNERQFFSVLLGRSSPALLLARTELAEALSLESLGLAERWQAPHQLSQAQMALGVTLVWRGEFEPAARHLVASLEAYESVPRRPATFRLIHDPGTASRAYLAWAYWMLGWPDRARATSDAAVEAGRHLAHPFSLTLALAFAAFVHHARRDVAATRARAEACIAESAEHGFAMYHAVGMMFRGWALHAEGKSNEALGVLESGFEAFRATGAVLVHPFYSGLIAEACAGTGDLPRARNLILQAISAAEKTGERIHLSELHRMLGDFTAAQLGPASLDGSGSEEVEHCYQRALGIAREQRALALELRAATALARHWSGTSRGIEARIVLGNALARFTEGLDTPDLVEAGLLFERLSRDAPSGAGPQTRFSSSRTQSS